MPVNGHRVFLNDTAAIRKRPAINPLKAIVLMRDNRRPCCRRFQRSPERSSQRNMSSSRETSCVNPKDISLRVELERAAARCANASGSSEGVAASFTVACRLARERRPACGAPLMRSTQGGWRGRDGADRTPRTHAWVIKVTALRRSIATGACARQLVPLFTASADVLVPFCPILFQEMRPHDARARPRGGRNLRS